MAPTSAGFTGTLFINGDSPTLSGDVLVVNGALATVTVDHAAGTVTGAGPSLIDYGTIERLLVNAGPSTTLAMTGSADYTVNPGAETDQGEVLSGGVPVTFDGFGSGETLALTGTGAGTVTVNGTAANDVFNVCDEHDHHRRAGDDHGHGAAHGDAERLRGRRRVQRERQQHLHDAEPERRRRR